MVELVVASKNEAKIREIKEILAGLKNIKFLSLKDYPEIEPIVEDGKSYEENAAKKARLAAQYTGKISLADDSGLEVDALSGAPGIYSSRFARDDNSRNRKLLGLLKDVPEEKRGACFRSLVAIANPEGELRLARGSCRGRIALKMRGRYGFGYDPIFIVPKFNKTFGELAPAIKNRVSHRAKALRQARRILEKILLQQKL